MQPRRVVSAPVRFARGVACPFRAAGLLLSERRLALIAVVAAPFHEALSAAVERKLARRVEEEPFSLPRLLADVWRVARLTALLLVLELLVVPVTTVVAFGLSGVLLALEFTDPPMERRRLRIRRRLRFARRHLWEMMGLGVVLLLLLGIRSVGAVFLPLGVVRGTILFVEAQDGIAGG